MALNTDGINALLNDGNEAIVWAAIGNGTLAGNQTSNERVQLTLGAPSGGVITVTNVPIAFTGTPAAGATHVLLYNQQSPTGETFYGSQALTGDQAFNASGDYQITSLTITGSST